MRNFVIGDIHGNYKELKELLNKLNPDLNHDKLIFLGDYIDRGPNSYNVIQFLIELQKNHGEDKVILLKGNHEQMAIENIETDYIDYNNGYDKTYKDFIKNKDNIESYYEFFKSLPIYHEDDFYIYVHGGIRPGITMEKQDESDLLWIRDEFYESSITFLKPIIFGHTPTFHINGKYTPFVGKDRIGIDTGIAYGGKLTALEIVDGKIKSIHQTGKLAA